MQQSRDTPPVSPCSIPALSWHYSHQKSDGKWFVPRELHLCDQSSSLPRARISRGKNTRIRTELCHKTKSVQVASSIRYHVRGSTPTCSWDFPVFFARVYISTPFFRSSCFVFFLIDAGSMPTANPNARPALARHKSTDRLCGLKEGTSGQRLDVCRVLCGAVHADQVEGEI